MENRHIFFGEENAGEGEARQKNIEGSTPEAFKARQKETQKLKTEFLTRAQKLKLGVKYSSEYLVTQVFEMRLEEGLDKLLNRHTTYEKDGNDYIFTHIDSSET
ncbi:MAG: hypothetical protein AAB871_00185 [Patescibacteria group bacterium]